MIRALTYSNPAFRDQLNSLARGFKAGNGTSATSGPSLGATHQAMGYMYNQMLRQSAALAYVDIIRYLTIFCACMLPLLFFIPKPPKNAAQNAGH
jgi:DHA2 family multidrug resistance protein